ARVPFTVWISLLLVAGLSMAGVGYFCGLSGRRSWLEVIVLVSTFGIVMFLVADLDRPQQGLLRTNQQPMIELNQKLGPP
ncbi:MAG: hypothetical protein K2X81_17665, partial [Candidatus Obscuribacterales bacterium]|nr:hypothetical protein [Candidatus Obscuribacterales bacterium]